MATNFLQAMGMPFNPDDPYGSVPIPAPVPAAPIAPPIIDAPPAPNVLAALQNPPAAPVAPQTAPQAAPQGTRPARARSSVLDVIGRVSDVLAKVGGAQALYQPTLDARQDRELALGDHDREIDMDKLRKALVAQQITMGEGGLVDANTARLQRAAQGLQAITNANPNADISALWPVIAKQMGIPDDQAGALGQAATTNPDIFRGLAGTTNDLGKNLYFGTDAQGNTVAYQIGKDGQPHILNFNGGVTPTEPTKIVDTGGSAVVVGQSGNTKRILPKTEAPGRAEDRQQRGQIAGSQQQTQRDIARGNNQTQLTIAGMPARAKAGGAAATGNAAASAKNADALLSELSGIYDKLNQGGAMVNPDNGTAGNVLSRLRSSGVGQMVEGAVGTQAQTLRDRVGSIRPQLMQTLAKATGMTGKQLDSNADVKLFMQTVTDPSASYQANQTAIAGLRRFLAENSKPETPVKPAAPARRPAAPARTPAPVKPRGSAGGGWSVIGVK